MNDFLTRFSFNASAEQIDINVGKVEIGQHVHQAFQLIVAEVLSIDIEHVSVSSVTTASSPDDGPTVGSQSIQVTGESLRTATKALRSVLTQEAAHQLNCNLNELKLDGTQLRFTANEQSCSIFDLPTAVLLSENVSNASSSTSTDKSSSTIPASILGERVYIQDIDLPDMVHARALRGRDIPAAIKNEISRNGETTVSIFKDNGFTALIANSETALERAWIHLHADKPARESSCDDQVINWIFDRQVQTNTSGEIKALDNPVSLHATRPFLLHASIAPSCALACYSDGVLQIWAHSQGIFSLRDAIANALNLAIDNVVIRHTPSAGCYGHNAADDAAMDAALVALHMKGKPVRVVWTRQDDFQFSPLGAPMHVQIEATLGENNSIKGWQKTIWSGPHAQRPGSAGNVNLLAAIERDSSKQSVNIPDLPDHIGGGAARNAVPPYAIGSFGLTTHLVQDLPVHTSSIRGLGAQMNVLAIEATMDKLAISCDMDPLEFRLKHIKDARARDVLLRLQATLNENLNLVTENQTIGIGYSRYKEKAAYAAVAVRVQLTEEVELLDVWAIVDAGRIVDESGALNQIEGGIIQAASWTLREGVLLRDGYADAEGWDEYPIISWPDIPTIHTTLVDKDVDQPSLGVGECMVGPVSAAIVNAVSRLAGCDMADLPLTREKFIEAAAMAI